MLPMTGCDVSPSTVTRQQDRLSFRITHMNRVYHIHCYCESDHAEWVAAVSFIPELSNNKILERIFLHKKVIKCGLTTKKKKKNLHINDVLIG